MISKDCMPLRRFLNFELALLDDLLPGGALWKERADLTLGLARLADLPAMKDQQVRPERPVFGRHDLHKILLDLHGIRFVIGEAKSIAHARDVRIDDDADVFVERIAKYDVG